MRTALFFVQLLTFSFLTACATDLIPLAPGLNEEAVSVATPDGDLQGSLVTPPASTNKPTLVLLIAGSGPTDRDGNGMMANNNSLKMIANLLGTNGYASLRFDKRGVGGSKAAFKGEEILRFDTMVNDAMRWIAFARARGEFGKIIVCGHSEGSLIGMLAVARSGADGFISLAGAGRPISVVLKEQLQNQPNMVLEPSLPIIDSLKAGHQVKDVPMLLKPLFRASVQPYMISWMAYDPAVEIAKLTVPVLILQGLNDTQVKEADAQALAAAKPGATLALLPHVTHVLKEAEATRKASNKTLNNPKLPLAETVSAQLLGFMQQF